MWWCLGVFVVVWCFCDGVCVMLFLWRCFLWWCFAVYVVVFLWCDVFAVFFFCGGVVAVMWSCFFVVVLLSFCGGVPCGELLWSSVVEKCCEGVLWRSVVEKYLVVFWCFSGGVFVVVFL